MSPNIFLKEILLRRRTQIKQSTQYKMGTLHIINNHCQFWCNITHSVQCLDIEILISNQGKLSMQAKQKFAVDRVVSKLLSLARLII